MKLKTIKGIKVN